MYALENNVCCGGSQQSQDSEPRGGGYPRVPCSRPARPGNPVQSSVDASNLTDYRKISQTKSNPQNSGIWSGSDLLISAKGEVIPEPVPVLVSVFLPLCTPDTGTGTFAVVSLEPAPTRVLAPSLERLPLYYVTPKLNL